MSEELRETTPEARERAEEFVDAVERVKSAREEVLSRTEPIVPEEPDELEVEDAAASEKASAEALASLKERKARIAQMLTRGTMNDRLADIDCPPDRRPVWVRETDEDVAYYKALGYRVETEFGRNFVDHDRGDNIARIGDVILMSIKMEEYELIQEVEEEQKQARRDAPRREFLAKAARVPEVPIFDEGN